MYSLIFLLLAATAAVLIVFGVRRRGRFMMAVGFFTAVATPLFFWFMGFWGEFLWFERLGFGGRFLTAVGAQAVMAGAGLLLGSAVVLALTWRAAGSNRYLRLGALVLGAVFGLLWGAGNWQEALKYIHRVETVLVDPILGKDTGFYLFALPFYDGLHTFFLVLTLLSFGVVFSTYFQFNTQGDTIEPKRPDNTDATGTWMYRNAAAVLLVMGAGFFLRRFHLLLSEEGVVTGPGWTDVHVRLPALGVLAGLEIVLAAVLLIGPLRRCFTALISRFGAGSGWSMTDISLPISAAVVTALVWGLGTGVVPSLFQAFVVEPNEITMEKSYIANNIRFTRHGFGLHDVEEHEFPVTDALPPRRSQARGFYENIRLWDWRVLDSVYQQFQEIRLYYEFTDVDVDRYTIDGDYRQMMISAREMEVENLPDKSRTFVNRRFKYTHGYGITLTDVSEFTPDGLPELLIKDIPPKSRYPELKVRQPRIYYGELSDDYVVVNSREKEFDYPSGEKNVYFSYSGRGGVPVTNLWRKFIYGYKFGGVKLFLSGYPTAQSRIMFHRQLGKRIAALAPFLRIDNDPYIVLSQGRLYWIVDAYTTSGRYPYSSAAADLRAGRGLRPHGLLPSASINGVSPVNYIRNAVKIVIDAYDGTVHFYIFAPDDPLIRVWDRIYPGLMTPSDQMPPDLRRHVRYPADMLLLQGLMYAKYHMTDPMVFYNQEDLWIRATEKYYNNVQPVEPYYIMWQPPGESSLQFVLMLPFTPKSRQVMIGWIAGMCDGENYGRFLSYKFPKEKRVLGTQQVETKIDQDRFLSSQLSLWDQRGSKVIRGNVLAIPIEKTMLYVEPIYLKADTAAYPELRLVAVMHQDKLSYAETFDKALAGLFTEEETRRVMEEDFGLRPHAGGDGRAAADIRGLIERANTAFEAYLRQLGRREFEGASRALSNLEQVLNRLSDQFPGEAREEAAPAPE